jgi:arginine/lysine/ornithine decarboxylase
MDRLYDKLNSYSESDYYPMHMPGHKRNTGMMQPIDPYRIDITEIDGFDNLHQPEGILKQLSERLECLYGAKKSFPLVNGSTAGILAGISAATIRGGKLLIARNSHKSVYHAAMINGLKPVYCYPPVLEGLPVYGGILASDIENVLISNKGIKLVVITSPTYEGVVSDIQRIAETVHCHGALLLVDEAHGAHFGFHPEFPVSAISLGADLVIQSLHKTLPAFTQTAVLHSNGAVSEHKLQQYLAIYQSSSPSYLLMAGIDRCISMLEDQGNDLFDKYNKMLQEFYYSMKKLTTLRIATKELAGERGVYALDPSKLTISVQHTGLSGHELQTILREKYHIEMEMAAPGYVLGMTSICDTEEGFRRLEEALLEIDRALAVGTFRKKPSHENYFNINAVKPVQVLSPQEAAESDMHQIKLSCSAGRISAAFISLFPPGSPLIVPGERMEQELIDYICQVKQDGITVTGLAGDGMDEIEVVKTMQ